MVNMDNDISEANSGLFEVLQPSPYKASPTNHSAYILLPALIMFAVTTIVVLVKTYTACTVFKRPRIDDYVAIAALVSISDIRRCDP